MNFEKQGKICTAITSKSILLSKSGMYYCNAYYTKLMLHFYIIYLLCFLLEYSVLMVDSTSNDQRQWNVTFFSYNSKTMTEEQMYNHGRLCFLKV